MPAALDVTPPPTEMESKELAVDAARHAMYAVATEWRSISWIGGAGGPGWRRLRDGTDSPPG